MFRLCLAAILSGAIVVPLSAQEAIPKPDSRNKLTFTQQVAPEQTRPDQKAPVLPRSEGRFYAILVSVVIGIFTIVTIIAFAVHGRVHAGLYFLAFMAFLMAWLAAICLVIYLTSATSIDGKIVASIFVVFGALAGLFGAGTVKWLTSD